MNNLKTVALLALLTGLLVLMGRFLGGTAGMVIALVIGLAINVVSYWFSDRIALSMAGAREVTAADEPYLFQIVTQITQAASMPMPRVYVIDSPSPNAFATGRDPSHAAIAVTRGIQQLLTPYELGGVIAHELAHVKNRDTLIATVVASVAGAISTAAQILQFTVFLGGNRGNEDRGSAMGGLVLALVAPLIATLAQLAVSRTREYEADAEGARLLGDPDSLADALSKLDVGIARRPMDAAPATAHLYIANPFGWTRVSNLFSTHPPMADRIARLRQQAVEMGVPVRRRPSTSPR